MASFLAWLAGETSSGLQQASQFHTDFAREYGPVKPPFVEAEFRTAWHTANTQYRFLAVYLHSASHQDTDGFCRDVLCHPEVAACLAEHFVIWAGDVSQPDAYRLATQVGVQRFPFFAVLMCLKNNPDSVVQYLLHPLAEDPQLRSLGVRQPKQPLVMKCDELVQADTFLASLTKVVDTESIHLTVTRLEQEELSTSRLIREEQDFEYNEALRLDEQKERERVEAVLNASLAEEQIFVKNSNRESQLAERKARLLPEPEAATLVGGARVLVRTLDGGRIMRRFEGTSLLQSLFDWVDVTAPDPLARRGDFKLVCSYPRRLFNQQEHGDLNIVEAGLTPDASLMVEEDWADDSARELQRLSSSPGKGPTTPPSPVKLTL